MNKYFKFWLTIISIFICFKLYNFVGEHYPIKDEGTIVRIIDGDTYRVLRKGIIYNDTVTVRVIGIDVAEKWHINGQIAIKKLKEYMPVGSKVTLEYDKQKKDKYGRTLAYVWYEGKEIRYWLSDNTVSFPMWIKPNDKHRLVPFED